MKGMRLLLVMPNIVSYHSFLSDLGEHLLKEGMEVHLATSVSKELLPKGLGQSKGMPVVHEIAFARGMQPLAHGAAAMALGKLVRRLQPDVVHAHFDAAIFAAALARRAGWPATLATFHGMSFPMLKGMKAYFVRWATGWAAGRFDTVYALQPENQQLLKAAAPSARIEVWPGFGVGCDLRRFKPVSWAEAQRLRAEFGFGVGERVFAFVGRFTKAKGFALTVRAFLEVAAGDPKARLLLVGCRDPLHPTGLGEHEQRALEASKQVIWAGNRNEVESCLGAVDVLVLPSYREGMPVCLMEALSMGVPVITSKACGCREVVRNGVDGLQVEGHAGIVAAMRQLAGERALWQRMSVAAVAGRERFSREEFVLKQAAVYRELGQKQKTQAAAGCATSVG